MSVEEKVTIPDSLKKNLDRYGARCIRVRPQSKISVDKDWNNPLNWMTTDDPRLKEWLENGGNYGVAGGNGVVILDADTEEIKQRINEKLPPTFTVETPGSGGWHRYYLCDLEKPIRLYDKEGKNLGDVQGPGKMVVGPGSVHPTGGKYKIIDDRPPVRITRGQIEEALSEYIVTPKKIEYEAKWEREEGFEVPIIKVVSPSGLKKHGNEYQGGHPIHGSTTGQNFCVNTEKNVWHCFRHGTGGGPLQWIAVKEGIIKCEEAVPGALKGDIFKQVIKVAKEKYGLNIAARSKSLPEKRKGKKTKKDVLIELALEDIEYFHDQYQEPHAILTVEGHREIWRLKSKNFRRWLAKRFWETEGKAVSRDTIGDSLNVLEAKACFDGSERKLHNRVCWKDEAIYYDLSDKNWRAIKIDEDGWEIVDNPILFRRYAHQSPQVEPIEEAIPEDFKDALLSFVNISEEYKQVLFLTSTISYIIPDIPHPNLITYGPQGATKSDSERVVKELVDNSSIMKMTIPRAPRELIQQLYHHYFSIYDNISYLPKWASDIFCTAISGGGFSKRELYTDDEDVIYSYKRCIGINGINPPANSPDLLDRSVLIGLKRPNKFILEQELWARFHEAKPKILGGLFSTISKAMRIMKESAIDPPQNLRMVDFSTWGEAIARALGYESNRFINAYLKNCGQRNLEAIEAHAVGTALLEFMKDRDKWEGTSTELLAELEDVVDPKVVKSKEWTSTPQLLSRRLNELDTNLKEIGIKVEKAKGKKRTLRVCKTPSPSSLQGEKEGDDNVDDKKFHRLHFHKKEKTVKTMNYVLYGSLVKLGFLESEAKAICKIYDSMKTDSSKEWCIGEIADRIGMQPREIKNILLNLTSNPNNSTPIRKRDERGDCYILDKKRLEELGDKKDCDGNDCPIDTDSPEPTGKEEVEMDADKNESEESDDISSRAYTICPNGCGMGSHIVDGKRYCLNPECEYYNKPIEAIE